MFWIIPVILFMALLLWVLLFPVIFMINTDRNSYYVTLPGVFKAAAVPDKELFHIRAWIFFVPIRFNPFRRRKKKSAGDHLKKPKRKKSRKRSINLRMFRAVFHAFRIRKLHLNLDTDDFILNARLIPLFSAVNNERVLLQSNFEGTASLHLDMRVRLGRLLWILIRYR